jgi:hypothetical protein
MAEWKKVIVSGSNAELNKLVVDTQVSASLFSGSFVGDGSALTGLTSAAITSYTNAGDNRVITSVNSTTVNSEENLTFDGSTLTVTGDASITGDTTLGDASGDSVTINAATIILSNPPVAGEEFTTVLVLDGEKNIVTDEIDSRVWGTTLVDAANGVNNRLATFTDSNSLNGEANLTFDGSVLGVTGRVNASGPITGSNLMLDGTLADGAGETTVLVIDSSGNVKSDEIDSRVWGTTLVDGSLTSGRVPYASDANTIQDSTNLTFNGTTLTVNDVSVTNNLTVGGNLTINGDLTNINTTNLNIEDQFILLASGSTNDTADIGIIFGGTGAFANRGASFFWDGVQSRFSVADDILTSDTTATPTGYVTIAYDTNPAGANQTPVDKVGNIKVDVAGDVFIYG